MTTLLIIHSILRWLVVASLFFCIILGWRGMRTDRTFGKIHDHIRHWTATIAHIQLIVGILLTTKSPYFKYFWSNLDSAWTNTDSLFFGLAHPLLMIVAIVTLTIGSAKAKRQKNSHDKFKTIFGWYLAATIIIFIAIPWPFSPFVERPYLTIN